MVNTRDDTVLQVLVTCAVRYVRSRIEARLRPSVAATMSGGVESRHARKMESPNPTPETIGHRDRYKPEAGVAPGPLTEQALLRMMARMLKAEEQPLLASDLLIELNKAGAGLSDDEHTTVVRLCRILYQSGGFTHSMRGWWFADRPLPPYPYPAAMWMGEGFQSLTSEGSTPSCGSYKEKAMT